MTIPDIEFGDEINPNESYRVSDLNLPSLPPMRIIETWTGWPKPDLYISVWNKEDVATPILGLGVLFKPRIAAHKPLPSSIPTVAEISGLPYRIGVHEEMHLANLTDWEVEHLKGKGLGRYLAFFAVELMRKESKCWGLHIDCVRGLFPSPFTQEQTTHNERIIKFLKQLADSVQSRLWVNIPQRHAEIIWEPDLIAKKTEEHKADNWIAL